MIIGINDPIPDHGLDPDEDEPERDSGADEDAAYERERERDCVITRVDNEVA